MNKVNISLNCPFRKIQFIPWERIGLPSSHNTSAFNIDVSYCDLRMYV